MPYPLPLTRTEAYLAYKAGVIQQSDLKPSLAVPRNGIDAWLAYWTELASYYPVKNLGKNLIDYAGHIYAGNHDGIDVSLNDATGQITVSGQPTRGYAKIVNTYDITNLLEDGKEYTLSQSAYDNKLYAQVNATPTTGSPVYIYSTSSAKTFTVDKTAYPRYLLVIQTGAQSAWTEPETITRTFQLEKGSSASAFEPYTGEPLILQEEEAYIAYLCGVINTYPDKCLRRVGAYLRYLISARLGRPDHPLNREELYLSLIKTQYIPSGDPSSDIEIDGTTKAQFVDVKMYGDTFQQTYTGKNLLKIVNTYNSHDGVTYTYDPETNIVTLDGTCTTDNAVFNLSGTDISILMDGQYVVSYEYVSGSVSNTTQDTKFQLMTQSYGNNFSVLLQNSSNSSTAAKSNVDYVRKNIRADAGVVFDNYKIKLQVEKGEAATPYEPYVGGIPAPNPDYPQAVQTVTGEQTVEVVGKNLFDKDHPNNSPCYVNNIGVLTSGGGANLSVYIPCEPNTTYTVSKSNTGTNNRFCVFDTEAKPAIGVSVISTVGTRVGADDSASYTITTGANAHYLGVFYRAGSTTPSESEIKGTIQIEKGSTATAYTPYSKQTYTINLGKNLLSSSLEIGGWRISVGSKIEKANNDNAYRCNAPITVKPNTEYIFSINGAAFDSFRVVYANAAGTILSNEVFTGTIKTPDNCFQIVFYSSAMKTAYPNIEDIKAQLEVGDTVTPYAGYFTPIELCKLDTYQDYIWKDVGDWKVHKATANITLNNTADTSHWSKSNSTANNVYINQNIPNLVKDSPIVATNLTNYPTADIYSRDIVGICYNTTGAGLASIRIGVGLSGASTIALFKSWLEENPVTAYYALATQTDTIITNQALIDQLEALVKGGSEDGTTYIKVSATDPNLPGLLYVEAAEYI